MTTITEEKNGKNFLKTMELQKLEIKDFQERLEMTDKETKNAKITRAILEWFESWQMWQKKILITGIVNRFQYSQLRGLLMAVESVFHKDFTTTVRKIYPMPTGEILEVEPLKKNVNLEKLLTQNVNKTSTKVNVKKHQNESGHGVATENTTEAQETENNMRMRSPLVGTRTRTTSGSELPAEESHILSPIEEGETATSEIEDNSVLPGHRPTTPARVSEDGDELVQENLSGYMGPSMPALISHLMNESPNMSQVSTLVSSLSPIEETSPESIGSGDSEDLDELFPAMQQSPSKREVTGSDLKVGEIRKQKNKLNKKKKSIPSDVVKKIASNSSLTSRRVSSNVCLTPIGVQSDVTLDFRSSISSAKINSDDFFDKINNKDVLGQPVTTQSKLEARYMENYDFARNRVPVPTRQQMYKNKKLWNRDTIDTNIDRLKEQFREQLSQIWEWIDLWPAHRRSRLMIELFSKSSEKMIKFAAECMKTKVDESDGAPAPINTLSDDLLLKIFDKLDLHDLMQASYTCNRWYAILNSDALWKDKCNEIGLMYGISNLVDLLSSGAEVNQSLDWKQAFTEVKEYLTLNMELESKSEQEEQEDEDSESEEESLNKFDDYIPYWKVHPPAEEHKKKTQSTKSSAHEAAINKDGEEVVSRSRNTNNLASDEKIEGRTSRKKGGFLQMWKNITEDIKEDLFDDAISHSCEDLDMLPDMQTWEDVALLTNIGQKFAVDSIIPDAIKACSKNWNIKDHILPVEKVKALKGHQGGVNVVKAQGNRIFTGSLDRCVRVWDKNGECFGKMHDEFKGGINDISIGSTEDCHVMYTASWDMCIRAWNTNNFKLLGTLMGHKDSVSKVAADCKFIVSSSYDGTIKVWDRSTLKCEKTIKCHDGAVESMVYHDKMIISGGIDKMIHITSALTGELIISYSGHHATVTALKKQHDLLASGDKHGMIYFWSLASEGAKHVDKVKAHESQINAISMHGPTFFSASKDALIKEWDLVTMTTVRVFQGHTDSVTDVLWKEKFLITASKDNDIRLWWWKDKNNNTGKNVRIKQN